MGLVEDSKHLETVENDDLTGAANANFDNDGEIEPKTSNPNPKTNLIVTTQPNLQPNLT